MSSSRSANDDELQRRRDLGPGDNPEAVERAWTTEFRRLTDHARSSYSYGRRRHHTTDEDPEDTEKRKALQDRQKYPEEPSPPRRVRFLSVLHTAEQSVVPVVHLSDYEELVEGVTNPEVWRLGEARIARGLAEYPVPRPVVGPEFPPAPAVLEQKWLPKKPDALEVTFLDRLLFTADKKRKDYENASIRYETKLAETQRQNQWKSELSSDRRCYWEYRKKRYEDANEAVINTWLSDRAAWDESILREKAEWKRIWNGYREGASSEAVTYFLHLCLDSVPMPHWFERDYTLTFSPDEGILLLDLRVPDFSSMSFLKNRELKSGTKEVPATAKERSVLIDKLTTFSRDQTHVGVGAGRRRGPRQARCVQRVCHQGRSGDRTEA
jgi:hypothetical protein